MNYPQHLYAVVSVEVSNQHIMIPQDQAMILYVADGEVEVIVDRRTFLVVSDSLLVIQGRNPIQIKVLQGEYQLVRFRNYHLVNEGVRLVYEENPLRFIHEFIRYEGVTQAVVDAFTALQKSEDVYDFQTLLVHIHHAYETYEHTVKQHAFEDVIRYMKMYAHHSLTRELVAKRFGYNANYFSESFKKETGWRFNEFLSHLRLEKAKIELLSSPQTIQEIARNVGYQDSLYLSRKFRQQVGLAPSKFRDHARIENVATLQFTGALLATGLKPSAVLAAYYNVPEVIRPQVETAIQLSNNWLKEDIGWGEQKPDLIIASVFKYPDKSYVRRLEEVAPVVAFEWDTYDRLEEVRMLGKLVRREEQAEAWIQQYENKIIEAQYALRSIFSPGTTVGVYELRNHGRVGIWRSSSRGAYNIYEMLRLQPNSAIEKEVLIPNQGKLIEESELPHYAADEMFVVVHSKEQHHRFFNEVWQSLPAMKRQKVHLLRLEDFWSSEGVALEVQLGIQLDYLLGNRKSDIFL
ncbi:helix-turn-helix domain-containing protein [Sporosarcina soli]|uniref:Helix-turn-helix domain-containing protein n=1 Tax=Sporosarcina soli TaxID=334736 RepID=A0ABW0TUH3_9BACL